MGCENRGVNVESLSRVERIYRNRLADEPSDTAARAGLAWCLFLQALHRAGEESTLEAVMESGVQQPVAVSAPRDSETLLQDALLHASTVLQLSPNWPERLDVERLRTLVELSGGFAAVAQAQESAREILEQIMREMDSDRTPSPVRRRRLPRVPRRELPPETPD
jgi:hypothetical protein